MFSVYLRVYLQADRQEMFIRYLAEQGHNVVKSERKPRKNIQYRDLGLSCHLGCGGTDS